MSTSRRQFQQLPLFLPAADIKAGWAPTDHAYDHDAATGEWVRIDTDDDVWERKARFAERRLGASLDEHGVRSPVSLSLPSNGERGEVLGGHHRIAYMAKHHPDSLVPVVFHTDFDEAQGEMDAYFGGYNNDAVASASWKPRDWRAR